MADPTRTVSTNNGLEAQTFRQLNEDTENLKVGLWFDRSTIRGKSGLKTQTRTIESFEVDYVGSPNLKHFSLLL